MSGKVRLDVLIEEAQRKTPFPVGDPNHWLVLINSDVFVSPAHCFAANSVTARHDLGLTGLRTDCPVTESYPIKGSAEALGREVVFGSQIQRSFVDPAPCRVNGWSAMDVFAHRKGFFEAIMESRNKSLSNLNFFIGVAKWDNAFVHVARTKLIDISPIAMLLHLTPNYDGLETWRTNATKWTHVETNEQVTREYPDGQVPDNVHNARQACFIKNREAAKYCALKPNAYDVTYRLCPSGNLVLGQRSDHQLYREATSSEKPTRTLPSEIKSGEWAVKLRCPVNETKTWTLFDRGGLDPASVREFYG